MVLAEIVAWQQWHEVLHAAWFLPFAVPRAIPWVCDLTLVDGHHVWLLAVHHGHQRTLHLGNGSRTHKDYLYRDFHRCKFRANPSSQTGPEIHDNGNVFRADTVGCISRTFAAFLSASTTVFITSTAVLTVISGKSTSIEVTSTGTSTTLVPVFTSAAGNSNTVHPSSINPGVIAGTVVAGTIVLVAVAWVIIRRRRAALRVLDSAENNLTPFSSPSDMQLPERRSTIASMRQLYISNEVNRAREKVRELEEVSSLLRSRSGSSHVSGVLLAAGSTNRNAAADAQPLSTNESLEAPESLEAKLQRAKRWRANGDLPGLWDDRMNRRRAIPNKLLIMNELSSCAYRENPTPAPFEEFEEIREIAERTSRENGDKSGTSDCGDGAFQKTVVFLTKAIVGSSPVAEHKYLIGTELRDISCLSSRIVGDLFINLIINGVLFIVGREEESSGHGFNLQDLLQDLYFPEGDKQRSEERDGVAEAFDIVPQTADNKVDRVGNNCAFGYNGLAIEPVFQEYGEDFRAKENVLEYLQPFDQHTHSVRTNWAAIVNILGIEDGDHEAVSNGTFQTRKR
ncbi:hypothetical protein DFH07DRAFT_945648 [Mycena maculata]|uniref:Uncharacterized protein n=1 Tax=Mycena maculata TaxID=230809 RepID=A0AAD7HV72_9AGAR|nr:hypothetical protein DFH07DRAFT_945648 [Mycena maculata]